MTTTSVDEGAKLTVGTRRYQVTFATAGPVGGHIAIAEGGKPILDRALAGNVEDNYGKWAADPRYKTWTTRPEYRSFIGGGEK